MMPINRKSIVSLSATASYDEVFETLDQDGCVILEKLTSSNTTDSIQRELALDIQNTLPGNGDFVGYKTKRTHTVLTNSKTAGLLALESLIMSICEFFLGPFCSKFQLSSSVVISL